MNIGTIIIIIVVGVLLILVFYAIGVYNNLINARNKWMVEHGTDPRETIKNSNMPEWLTEALFDVDDLTLSDE